MKPSLQLRLNQQLALTPQLQQSIRLLQLSTLELHQELEHALAENPLLERVDAPLSGCASIAPNGSLDDRYGSLQDSQRSNAGEVSGLDGEQSRGPAPADQAEERDASGEHGWDSADDSGLEWGVNRSRASDGDDDEHDYPQLSAAEVSLREHLTAQLASTHSTPRDRVLAGLLIDALDDDGMLESSLAEVLAMLPAELEVGEQELATALRLLQSFDPSGIAARDLRECLLLQLHDDGEAAAGHPAEVVQLARAIVSQHLPTLAEKDFAKLRRALHCDEDTLREAHDMIRALNPKPGARFADNATGYIVPDVIVRRTGSGWQAALNPDVMPKLRINDMYARILRRNRGVNPGLSGQLQEARWLIKNVQQRFDTILRVAQAIVDRQRAFLSHGAVAMRPLVLREIAETLGLHESTISRVTTQKYMLTPSGIFELKHFFGSHVATDSGGAASSTAIRALMKQLVSAEDASQPLSDSQIAAMLGEQGLMVARRTVAKYRESMRIPPVSQRRSL